MMIAIATLQSESAEELTKQEAISVVVDSFEGSCAILEQNSKKYKHKQLTFFPSSGNYCV
jgi:formylmethanofuran dehydrogenase subunit D